MRKIFFPIVVILMLAVLIFLVATLPGRVATPRQAVNYLTPFAQIDYANKLLSKGLKEPAAEVFEEYLSANRLSALEEANLLYKVGSIYMELYKYEKALKNFYKAEMIEPKAAFAQEMNQKIIEALENLGMSSQARYELQARTSLGKGEETKARVVARIGTREISDAEIDEVLKNAPEGLRKSLEDPRKRLEFIRNYVGQEALYIKARRLGLDTREEVRQALEQLKKQIVVEQFLGAEVREKLNKISSEDVKLYYEANKDSFKDPAQIKANYLSFENEAQKGQVTEKIKKQQGRFQEVLITEGETSIPGIGGSKDIIAGMFLKEKGQASQPLKIRDKFYIFYILEKKPARQRSFTESEPEVEREYRMKKQQEIIQDLLKNVLEDQEVKIFETANKNDAKKNN